MTVEIQEKPGRLFYREAINVAVQFRQLQKNPNYKLKDYFRQFSLLLAVGAGVLLLLGLVVLLFGARGYDLAAGAFLLCALILCAAFRLRLNQLLKASQADTHHSFVTLDEDGVELNKEDFQRIRISWNNIASVRLFSESLNFLSADQAGLVISVSRRYADDMIAWLTENRPDIRVQ